MFLQGLSVDSAMREVPVYPALATDANPALWRKLYADLAKKLKKHGFKGETEADTTNKLKRGTFSAMFFLACIATMELEGVALEEI